MSYDPQSAKFADILLAIKNQLVTELELDESVVRIVASDSYDLYAPTPGDRVIFIRPYGPQPDTDHGGGRRSRPKYRRVRTYLYYRSSLDQAGDDVVALTAEDGLFEFEERVCDVLDEFYPVESDERALTIEPLHPLDSEDGPPARKHEDDTGWLRSHQDWLVRYVSRNQTA